MLPSTVSIKWKKNPSPLERRRGKSKFFFWNRYTARPIWGSKIITNQLTNVTWRWLDTVFSRCIGNVQSMQQSEQRSIQRLRRTDHQAWILQHLVNIGIKLQKQKKQVILLVDSVDRQVTICVVKIVCNKNACIRRRVRVCGRRSRPRRPIIWWFKPSTILCGSMTWKISEIFGNPALSAPTLI